VQHFDYMGNDDEVKEENREPKAVDRKPGDKA